MTDGVSLPSFREPPITEVVVGVAFRDTNALTPAHIGDCWTSRWAERFPRVEEHPSYATPIERFDMPPHGPNISLELTTHPSLRLWFVSEDGTEIIQAQKDWFACNWRKVDPGAAYDRWPARREAFETHYREFEDYVGGNGLGKVTPIQCEVTYVNHIQGPNETLGDLSDVLKLAGRSDSISHQAPQYMQLSAAFEMMGDSEERVGRLHVSAQPATLRDGGRPIYVINLTARGPALGEGLDGALRFLDRGREAIVTTFAEITTEQMHEAWGRYA